MGATGAESGFDSNAAGRFSAVLGLLLLFVSLFCEAGSCTAPVLLIFESRSRVLVPAHDVRNPFGTSCATPLARRAQPSRFSSNNAGPSEYSFDQPFLVRRFRTSASP